MRGNNQPVRRFPAVDPDLADAAANADGGREDECCTDGVLRLHFERDSRSTPRVFEGVDCSGGPEVADRHLVPVCRKMRRKIDSGRGCIGFESQESAHQRKYDAGRTKALMRDGFLRPDILRTGKDFGDDAETVIESVID